MPVAQPGTFSGDSLNEKNERERESEESIQVGKQRVKIESAESIVAGSLNNAIESEVRIQVGEKKVQYETIEQVTRENNLTDDQAKAGPWKGGGGRRWDKKGGRSGGGKGGGGKPWKHEGAVWRSREQPGAKRVGGPGASKGGKAWDSGGKPDGEKDGQLPPLPPDVQAILGRFVGRIKEFNSEQGHGSIACRHLRAQGYIKDASVSRAQLGDFQVGEQVSFTCFLSIRGKLASMGLARGIIG